MNAKNLGLSPAVADLGLGDMLRTQLDDETEEQRRRRLQAQQAQKALTGAGMGGAAQALFGNGNGPLR